MKTFAKLFILAFALFAIDAPARADSSPGGQYSTLVRVAPNSATLIAVAAGAVINSGAIDVSAATECTVIADNSAGGATRALVVNFLAADKTTVVFSASNTVAIAGRGATVIGPSVAAASVPTGMVIVPTGPSPFMSFSLAAAGAAAGTLQWFCR